MFGKPLRMKELNRLFATGEDGGLIIAKSESTKASMGALIIA